MHPLPFSLSFSIREKIKEETVKAGPLLVNMKGTDDKTWESRRSPLFTTATKFQTRTCDQIATAHT